MFIKRTSPNLTPPLAGRGLEFGDTNPSYEESLPRKTEKNQEKSCGTYDHSQQLKGNRCGHLPNAPRSAKFPSHHKRRPYILEESKRRLSEIYYNPFKYEAGKLCYDFSKKNKDQTYRKRRTELKETLTHAVGEAIFHYMDLNTKFLGFTDDKGIYRHYGVDFLAKKTGFSYQRVRKALKMFEEAGYITIERRRFRTEDGDVKSAPSLIRVHELFFFALDFSKEQLETAEMQRRQAIAHEEIKRKYEERNQKRKLEKKQKRTLLQLIHAARSGDHLSEREQAILDKEQPGWRNAYQRNPIAKDFTGLSGAIKSDSAPSASPDVRRAALAEIFNTLKKPPS